jgi:hypothetical protein
MRKFIIFAIALILAACSTATELPPAADGQRQLIVRCGTATMSFCAKRAAEECGGEYDFDRERSRLPGKFHAYTLSREGPVTTATLTRAHPGPAGGVPTLECAECGHDVRQPPAPLLCPACLSPVVLSVGASRQERNPIEVFLQLVARATRQL